MTKIDRIPLVGPNHKRLYTQESIVRREKKLEHVGYRLAKRKDLFHRRRVVADFGLVLAILGILLAVLETELVIGDVYDKGDPQSLLLKLCVSVSTGALLGFVVWYQVLDIRVFLVNNCLEDWRLALSFHRMRRIVLELFVCAIHPLPGQLFPPIVDVYLTLPMFLRGYLIARVMKLHSRLFTDASSQSLGALNRISFNFAFIFRSLMSLSPEVVLGVVMTAVFVLGTWMLHACEMTSDERHSLADSLWLVAVTFFTIGYGDVVPASYCGRGVAVLCGMVGVGCTALTVAVIAKKLELSRAERYVHTFVMDVELDKKFKCSAADIVKFGWLSYRARRQGKPNKAIVHHRRLISAIHRLRNIRQEQRRLADNAISMLEVHKSQEGATLQVDKLVERTDELAERVDLLGSQLQEVTAILTRLASKMNA